MGSRGLGAAKGMCIKASDALRGLSAVLLFNTPDVIRQHAGDALHGLSAVLLFYSPDVIGQHAGVGTGTQQECPTSDLHIHTYIIPSCAECMVPNIGHVPDRAH